jgi:hypothetical protein
MTEGVPLDQLHCPTCGDRFTDFNLHTDPEEFQLTELVKHTEIKARGADWYMRCPQGHKWTVIKVWREFDATTPDKVQLERYLGCE